MRLYLRKQDFKSRITSRTLIVVIMCGLINGGALLWNFDSVTRDSLQSRVRIESDIISQNIASSLLFDDAVTASEILASFRADPAVLLVTLQTADNGVFASYKNERFNNSDENVFTLVEDIRFEGGTLGTLNLVISENEIYHQNIASATFLLVILLIVFVLSATLIEPMVRSLLEPLLNLHNVSEKIAKTRDYSQRVRIQSDDEVGRLSQMFNVMVEQIEHRDIMLEKKVGQRTTELEKLAEEFRFRAFHDSLTGLPNRALLNERFEHSIEHAKRFHSRFACLLLDLDDFKAINDTKGHEFGDELLVEVAVRLKATIRAEDLVCRLGGDEFVVLLNDLSDVHDANMIARKILTQLNRDFIVKDERVRTAVSIGGAVFPDHGNNLSTIKRHADVAMYRAKDSGKNRFCLFSDGMQEEVKHRQMIQSDLQPALDQKQFEIYVQPKIDSEKKIIVGCEALVRWNHPVKGFLTPDKFIPYAEEVGMIAEIDYFVIHGCCELIIHWAKVFRQHIPIAFNLSGRHFHDFKIVTVLEQCLNRYKINPSLLEVEITEAVLIQDPEKAQKIVHAIRELGLGISLDDFGTGYSSLNYLRTLPIDTVKLDRSFVSNITTSKQDRRLTRGIVSLAKGLNLKLVAEGVETEEQVEALLELGCSTMQGYYFLVPSCNAKFMHWYLKQHAINQVTVDAS